MKIKLLFLLAFVFLLPAATALAGGKDFGFFWGADHWRKMDFENRYLLDGKTPQNATLLHHWKPEDWAQATGGDPLQLIRDFYNAGIITDQYINCDGTMDSILDYFGLLKSGCQGKMVLEVGIPFMRLSNQDKHRVAAYVDYVYEVTATRDNGAFVLYHSRNHEPVGVYTQSGLQLQ